MRSHFVSDEKIRLIYDGESRLRPRPEHRAQLLALRKSIREKYAKELEEAGFLEVMFLYWRMQAEYQRESRKIVSHVSPSPQSLYLTRASTPEGE